MANPAVDVDLLQEEQPQDEALLGESSRIWAIGGGKGGIGKSFVTTNIAVALAQRGLDVVVIDADLGGANLHTCLGIPYPPHTLADFLDGRAASLEEILIETSVPRLRIISGASDILTLANPHWSQKQKLLRHIRRLQADVLLLDLGAGTTFNVLDFFNSAARKIVVVTPEPTSIQNAYGFVKSALYRRLSRAFSTHQVVADLLNGGRIYGGATPPETIRQMVELLSRRSPEVAAQFAALVRAYSCELVLNMASPPQDKKVFSVMRSVTKGYLDLDLGYVGAIPRDEHVPRSVDQMSPLLLSYPETPAAAQIREIAGRLSGR